MTLAKAPAQQMLDLAKAIVLREHDITSREHDITRREHELAEKKKELSARKSELAQLRFDFAQVANGEASAVASLPEERPGIARVQMHAPLARMMATIAQRVLAVLEMEPRAFTPGELFNVLELPPPIETLRTTLWKMADRGLIARPFKGVYCALQYEAAIVEGAKGVG